MNIQSPARTFQTLLNRLNAFWAEQGCLLMPAFDGEKGASTMSPSTFLRVLGPEPWAVAMADACRRPTDGRYGENPNRLQHYYQYQVILKPIPDNIQALYLQSLMTLGIDPKQHDIRFVEDNWESPTLGAWGVGWEVWLDGLEITQYTYFQQAGGLEIDPPAVELTYGCERIAMFLQGKNNVYDLNWNDTITYGQLFKQNEIEGSTYNFEVSTPESLHAIFNAAQAEVQACLAQDLPIPAHDWVLKCSHTFNLMDARGIIGKDERMRFILAIRKMAEHVAKAYLAKREALGYPLVKRF
ncbi:MAG: glycine--tRNA ligase subunit alpha [Vampirovibrionales bacterium]|nr:glycine--tRNA ligase subunit alpha [Vampirovibrionales bacterium]